MWLLNTTSLKLRTFIDQIPDYVILSHTWGEGEVTFDDVDKPHASKMAGYEKLQGCCSLAIRDGFEWAWIDTCCIDKRSSAELSEAINSMYAWYWQAAICYAYLSDVTEMPGRSRRPKALNRSNPSILYEEQWEDMQNWQWEFRSSRWFKRGWTLQELLAPDVVEFYSGSWAFLGTKSKLKDLIHEATKIETRFMVSRETVREASVATKLSWASLRQTSRVEDGAYCLLGLVGINMPMLYGEGSRAFNRLQLEIIRQTSDHSILAWQSSGETRDPTSVLATSAVCFKDSATFRPIQAANASASTPFEITGNGLRTTLPCVTSGWRSTGRVLAILGCKGIGDSPLGLWLEDTGQGTYRRSAGSLTLVSEEWERGAKPLDMYLVVDADSELVVVTDPSVVTVKAVWTDKDCSIGNITTLRKGIWIESGHSIEEFGRHANNTHLMKELVLTEGEASSIRLHYGIEEPSTLINVVVGLRNNRAIVDIPSEASLLKDWYGGVDLYARNERVPLGDHMESRSGDTSVQIHAKKKHVDQQLLWSLTISIFQCMCMAANAPNQDCMCDGSTSTSRHLLCYCDVCLRERSKMIHDHALACCCCACWTDGKIFDKCLCPTGLFHEEGLKKGKRSLIQKGTGTHYLECPCKLCELESKLLVPHFEFRQHKTKSLSSSKRSGISAFDWLRNLRDKRADESRSRSST